MMQSAPYRGGGKRRQKRVRANGTGNFERHRNAISGNGGGHADRPDLFAVLAQQRHTLAAHLRTRGKSKGNNPRVRRGQAVLEAERTRVVSKQRQHASGLDCINKRGLFLYHRLRRIKKLDMHRHLRQQRYNRYIYRKPRRKRADVAGAVGADLEYEPLRILPGKNEYKNTVDDILQPAERVAPRVGGAEYGKRQTDLAVKTFFALADAGAFGKHGIDGVFGGGLADTAGHRDNFRLILAQNRPRLQRNNPNNRFFKYFFHYLSGGML